MYMDIYRRRTQALDVIYIRTLLLTTLNLAEKGEGGRGGIHPGCCKQWSRSKTNARKMYSAANKNEGGRGREAKGLKKEAAAAIEMPLRRPRNSI
jgi:hypothetical protein